MRIRPYVWETCGDNVINMHRWRQISTLHYVSNMKVKLVMKGPVKLIKTRRFRDSRGWFSETFVEDRWRSMGVTAHFMQDNHSYSTFAGTIRGIHFQLPPYAQAKLVRCTRGRIMDYVVDLRRGSPTYAHHIQAELTADSGDQLYLPAGFGHAFITLEPNCEVMYKVDAPYSPKHDAGLRWNCPEIGIDWPLPSGGAIVSDKDAGLPDLSLFDSPFEYDGQPMFGLD